MYDFAHQLSVIKTTLEPQKGASNALNRSARAQMGRLSLPDPTSALTDGYDSRANTIDGFLDAFKVQPAQIGVIYLSAARSPALISSVPRPPSQARSPNLSAVSPFKL
jgi:hypothetical protein